MTKTSFLVFFKNFRALLDLRLSSYDEETSGPSGATFSSFTCLVCSCQMLLVFGPQQVSLSVDLTVFNFKIENSFL